MLHLYNHVFFLFGQGVWSTPKANEKKLNATFKVRLISYMYINIFYYKIGDHIICTLSGQ